MSQGLLYRAVPIEQQSPCRCHGRRARQFVIKHCKTHARNAQTAGFPGALRRRLCTQAAPYRGHHMKAAPVLIDGEWIASTATEVFAASNPRTREPLPVAYPISGWSEAERAVQAAA